MGLVSLADVQPGMVLRADVAREGRLLLGAGARLTERDVRLCAMWDVAELDVEGLSRDDVAEAALERLAPAAREAIARRVESLFRHNDPGDPVIAALLHLATMRHARAESDAHGA
jgi:hypothetical protein